MSNGADITTFQKVVASVFRLISAWHGALRRLGSAFKFPA